MKRFPRSMLERLLRLSHYAFWSAAFAFGLVAELVGRPPLPALDAATGFSLLALGLLAWSRQSARSGVGSILAMAGAAWFAGTIAGPLAFLHRGPLAQLLLTYPATRPSRSGRAARIGVTVAYVYALVYPIASNNEATIVFALGLVAGATWRYRASGRAARRPNASALAATVAFSLVMAVGAVFRLAGAGGGDSLLAVYELVIIFIAAGLTADLLWGKWTQALVTTLVVDLGEPDSGGTLRDQLARTLGDPTLSVGYWVSDREGYVDEHGQPVALPADDDGRRVKLINERGAPSVVLIHDPAVLNDPGLLSDVAAATRLAVANARLQSEIRTRVAQVDASRRRLVESGDEQRRQLERELREGAERRLAEVAEELSGGGLPLAQIGETLDAAVDELHELARGIHPATLTHHGLLAAVGELAARSSTQIEVSASAQRWPPAVEGAAYFVCSEAITNVAKYAHATRVDIQITDDGSRLLVEIADDGIGGADESRGSGLRGLTDRVEALGGRFMIESPPDQGTRLRTELPLSKPDERVPQSTPHEPGELAAGGEQFDGSTA